ncbi:response regulator [Sphingomonas sp. ASV193]|uniref:response regulator n=1 Tax=Sphingomonas sp. ASV193 TaxID=3144405 RepID=UPI0032E87825
MTPAPASPSRILLIQPSSGALAVIARRLAEAGHRVVSCDAPAQAVAELHRASVDLVLAEIRMVPVSGVELTRLVRDDSALRDTPVILIGGRSDAGGAIAGFAAGADDVVAKPFDFDLLLARIDRALRRAKAVRQLKADNATLDARVIERAVQLGETRMALAESEAERRRLERMVMRA